MAGLCTPLPTLRRRPCGRLRTARGQCGSLLLHRKGLPPSTPCRSPGALRKPAQQRKSPRLLDQLIGTQDQRWRNVEAEGFGGFEFEHKLKFGRGLNWIANGNIRKKEEVRRET